MIKKAKEKYKETKTEVSSKSLKAITNRFFKSGDVEMPYPVKAKFTKILVVAALVFVIGIVVIIAFSRGLDVNMVIALLFPFVIAVGLTAYAFYYKYQVTNRGFDEYEGKCISVKRALLSALPGSKKSKALVVDCGNMLIHVPLEKVNEIAPVGSIVRIFTNKEEPSYEYEGVTHFANILAYEIVASEIDESTEYLGEDD